MITIIEKHLSQSLVYLKIGCKRVIVRDGSIKFSSLKLEPAEEKKVMNMYIKLINDFNEDNFDFETYDELEKEKWQNYNSDILSGLEGR